MEGDFIRIHKWLLPLSWCYGLAVGIRNQLFEMGILKSRAFKTPIISIGNITVGGSGKTPHVEYIVKQLHDKMKVAVLSRGYKRKTKGFVLASKDSTAADIGDEPFQMKKKFADIYVAVDANRCRGIDFLTENEETKDTDVILLDDAYQHRYVKPGVNILLIDYHRLIIYDKLLPAGRLREPKQGKNRADIVIITKCPNEMKPMEFRVLTKALGLFPYQKLFFTKLKYNQLKPLYAGEDKPLSELTKDTHVVLLTGIASPKQMMMDLSSYTSHITPLTFADHHAFRKKDIQRINEVFAQTPEPKIIITTEKDNARLFGMKGLSDEVRQHIYMLPIEIEFLLGQQEEFNEKIIGYVHKNSRNSILAKAKDDHKPNNRNRSGDRPGTISFRNN
jgi:tetraacyldisaccharide 4'-kinase